MKKVISLALCVMMIASICAMGVNAAVPMQTKSAPVQIGLNDGDTNLLLPILQRFCPQAEQQRL